MRARRAAALVAFGLLAAATAADPAKPDPPPAGTPQDVAYFAPGGPVRVRFRVTIGGRPAEAAWHAATDKLFAFCDRNGDGKLDAKERAVFTRPGRAAAPVEVDDDGNPVGVAAGAQVFAEKDAPADKAAFAAKLRAAGLGPVAVAVQAGSGEARPLTDALFRQLDQNGDGKLSADELGAAADRFAALDLDEDELITGPELRGTAVADAGRRRFQPRPPRADRDEDDDPPAGDLLALPAGSAAAVKAVLAARDGDKNGSLSRAEFGGGEKAFAGLDKDGNGQLDSDEIAAWLRRPPDLEFDLAFDGTPAAGLKPDADGAVTRPLADARLRLTADGAGAKALADGWKQSADRVRAEFDRLGKGKAGVERKQVEGTREGRGLLPAFDLADRNADKTLTREELDAALAALGAAAVCRVEVTITDQGRGLFELFDRNGDGQLSPRELRAAAGLAKALDRDGDGRLDKAEIPRLLPVTAAPAGISVLTAPQPPAFVREAGMRPPPRPAARSDGPPWFAKMDRNGDGDVSRREFLGPADLFRKLDRDGDGLLSPEEAKAAR